MTLTEFLLARIAEDEATTFALEEYGCPPGCCAPEGWVGHRCLLCGGAASFGGTVEAMTAIAREHEEDVHRRSRVLAECVAKRAIVGIYSTIEMGEGLDGEMVPLGGGGPEVYYDAIRHLAAVYAEHPDYDEAWRA